MKYSYLYGAEGSPITYSLDTYRDKTKFVMAAFLATVAVFGIIASQLIHIPTNSVQASPDTTAQPRSEPSQQPQPTAPQVSSPVIVEEETTPIDISAWLLAHKGTYSISVFDQDGKPLVDANSSEHYFMASIYKLYVAYVGYQRIDSGAWSDDANYWQDWSRTKCLDEMIRSSHNPCGEAMLAEIGYTNIQAELDEYGLENTSFKLFTTSSADVANVLVRLQKGLDLSATSKQKLMDSMVGQIYREGLPKGFGDDWIMYDKVGFRDKDEYHDVGIVVTPEGKTYIVSVLTRNAGADNIADLARTIKSSVQ